MSGGNRYGKSCYPDSKTRAAQSNRDTFVKLEINGIISQEISLKMQAMAGFRNLAVHDYGSMNIAVVIDIIENRLNDLPIFAELIMGKFGNLSNRC